VNRRRFIAIPLCAALLFGGAAKCEEKEGGSSSQGQNPRPDFANPIQTRGVKGEDSDHNGVPDPWEAQDDFNDKLKVATISVWLPLEFCPYEVEATVEDGKGGVTSLTGDGKNPKWKVSEGQWRQVAGYPAGTPWTIHITVQAAKTGDTKGYIAIRDGKRINKSVGFNKQSRTTLTYTTQR